MSFHNSCAHSNSQSQDILGICPVNFSLRPTKLTLVSMYMNDALRQFVTSFGRNGIAES